MLMCVCYCRSLPQHTGDQHSSEKLRVLLQCQPHHADHRQDHGLPLRHSGLRCPWWQPDKSVLLLFFNLCSQLLIVLSYFKACCLLAGEVLHAVLLLHFRLWYRLDGTFQTFGLKLVKVPQLTSLVTSWLASAMFVMKQRFSGPSKKNGDVVKLNNTG